MYVINDYQLIATNSQLYLSNYNKGVKITSEALAAILEELKNQAQLEISEEELLNLAERYNVEAEVLKKTLITQLNVLKPLKARKFPQIIINADDELIAELLKNTLSKHYQCTFVPPQHYDFTPDSLVIFYRHNYSHTDFATLYQQLGNEIYLITAGVIHKLLVIDNLYLKESGLPSHFSNLHQLMTYLKSDIPATKNNWLLFYRELCKQQVEQFPDAVINSCQQGYIAYCLYQFVAQFTNLWSAPTTIDKVNWFWHVDLTNFTVQQEIAVHSPFSEQDMRLTPCDLERLA